MATHQVYDTPGTDGDPLAEFDNRTWRLCWEEDRRKTLAQVATNLIRWQVDAATLEKLLLEANDRWAHLKQADVDEMVTRALEMLPKPASTRLSDVQIADLAWAWRGRFPIGKVVMLDGNPGLGKSLLMLDIAARVTTGRPMPDGTPGVEGAVILVGAEDDAPDTIKPRVLAAGGDPSKVFLLDNYEVTDDKGRKVENVFTLPGSIPALKAEMVRTGAKLVIIDAVMNVMGGKLNSHVDQDVRQALNPLRQLAAELGATIICIRHFNRSENADPLKRGMGSTAFGAVSRSALMVAPDPDDEDDRRRILAVMKNNLSVDVPSWAYRIEAVRVPGVTDPVPHIQWLGASHHTAISLSAPPLSEEDRAMREMVPLGPASIADGDVIVAIATEFGKNKETVRRRLDRMVQKGIFRRPSRGRVSRPRGPVGGQPVEDVSDVSQASYVSDVSEMSDSPPPSDHESDTSDIPDRQDISDISDISDMNVSDVPNPDYPDEVPAPLPVDAGADCSEDPFPTLPDWPWLKESPEERRARWKRTCMGSPLPYARPAGWNEEIDGPWPKGGLNLSDVSLPSWLRA